MEEARNAAHCVGDALCDGLKQICDFSYAVLPKDIAHAVGDLKKSLLSEIRCVVDWEIEWISDRVAGGDKLRDEWKEKCRPAEPETETAV